MPIIAFKDSNGGFYQAEVPDENDVPAWASEMTRLAEEQRLAESAASQPDPVQQVKGQIEATERETLMNRAVREFMLAQAEQIAAAAGYTPEQLYLVNLGYKKVKNIDDQIAALRAQIGEL